MTSQLVMDTNFEILTQKSVKFDLVIISIKLNILLETQINQLKN